MNVPSGYTALDLIGFTDRGDYVSTDNYVKNDLVHYNGRVWKCLIDDTTGITPVEGANWTVWIDEAAYLSGLADVTITNPANGQVIRYNSQNGKWENVGVDSTPTSGSANLVQSGGVATQLANKANSADLATVATSGDYQDLNNLPTLADVATTGQYSDLLGLPTIPTVNNGTLTLQINGVTVETFNANDSNNKTANFNVPTKTSDLTNDSNFVSDANYQHITVDSAFSDTSTNPVQNKVVNSLKETLTQQINENGVKNVIPFPYSSSNGRANHSITYTYDNDGVVNANGTADAASTFYMFQTVPASELQWLNGMVLCGLTDGDNNNYFSINMNTSPWTSYARCTTAGVIISGIPNDSSIFVDCIIRVGSGKQLTNKKFYPMICRKDLYDADPTYVPPAKTNQQLTKETTGLIDNQNVNGAVNMLPNLRESVVDSGITYIVNADGSVTCNGTATANNHLEPVKTSDNYYLPKGTYKLTGCPSGGTDDAYYIRLYNLNSGAIQIGREYGDGLVFNLTESTRIGVQVQFMSGYTANNLTFKPMITVPSYDGDYVPYAKSNKELTEESTYEEDTTTITNVTIMKRNNVVTLEISGNFEVTHNQMLTIGTLPTRFRSPISLQVPIITNEATPQVSILVVNTSGVIQINGYLIATTGTYPFIGNISYVTK